jgi:hypothetical protein
MQSDEDRKKEKLQISMEFEQSDLWDSIHFVLDTAIKNELAVAVNQSIEDSKRVHQCGRADGIMYIKDLLIETRELARKNSGRSS